MIISRILSNPHHSFWTTVDWCVLACCVLSSSMSGYLAWMGWKCGSYTTSVTHTITHKKKKKKKNTGNRFSLMTAMGVSASVSFWYRIWLLSATLANRYHSTFASPIVHMVMFASNVGTTVFYSLLAATTLHTFAAITLHPSQYDPIKASRSMILWSFGMAFLSIVLKWSSAVIVQLPYCATNWHVQPSPRLPDGRPWSPKARLLWWTFTPVQAKPHSIVNLFLLLVIGAASPVFLLYVLRRMVAVRGEARRVLGPSASSTITANHIFRIILTIASLVTLSVSSIITMLIDGASRGNRHLNLYVIPTPKELALRYTFSCATGIVLFVIYTTGDELIGCWAEYLMHEHFKQFALTAKCPCRRCRVEIEYPRSMATVIDPITTLPVGISLINYNEDNDHEQDTMIDNEVDFFEALKDGPNILYYEADYNMDAAAPTRCLSVDSVATQKSL